MQQEYYARQIQELLIHKTYVPGPYVEENIIESTNGKERVIQKPRYYPDQIIHWCLMLQLEKVIMKGMYTYCCGSIPKRGIHYAMKAVKGWLKHDRKNTKYCVKLDISKFYPSIDNNCLKALFRKRVKDPDVLWLIDAIIDSHPKGLPIGNYTSQWFSNYYLQWFDHYVKEQLGVKYYVRYMDDCCLFGPNKKKLRAAFRNAEAYLLLMLGLKVKPNWQLFKVDSRGVDFVGYRMFRGYTLIRKKTALRISRRARRVRKKEMLTYHDAAAIVSYNGWLDHCNSYNFRTEYIQPLNYEEIRKVISNASKQRYDAAGCVI